MCKYMRIAYYKSVPHSKIRKECSMERFRRQNMVDSKICCVLSRYLSFTKLFSKVKHKSADNLCAATIICYSLRKVNMFFKVKHIQNTNVFANIRSQYALNSWRTIVCAGCLWARIFWQLCQPFANTNPKMWMITRNDVEVNHPMLLIKLEENLL